MSEIPTLHSPQYYQDLRDFRNRIIAEAPIDPSRTHGNYAGTWDGQDEGEDALLYVDRRHVDQPDLSLWKKLGSQTLLTIFAMDLGSRPTVRFSMQTLKSEARSRLALAGARHTLQGLIRPGTPTEGQLRKLYVEMQRGASRRYQKP
jgi:hypothetical protein